jgi:hypothetical protein
MPGLVNAKLKGKYNAIRALASEVPNSLCAIVARSIMADKERRYADAAAFGEALDRALRQFTDQPPSQIVKDFVEGTRSESIPAVHEHRRMSANTRFFLGLAASLALMAGLLAGALLTFDRFDQRGERERTTPVVAAGDSGRPAAEGPGRDTPPRQLEPPIKAAVPGAVETPKPAPAAAPVTGKTQVDRPVSIGRTPPAGKARTVRVDPATASAAAPSRFMAGRQNYLDGAHDKAEELLQTARTADATAGSPEWIDITYYWAMNRTALYDKKPNAENRRRARTAWEEFAGTACSGYRDDRRCEEARGKAAALVR